MGTKISSQHPTILHCRIIADTNNLHNQIISCVIQCHKHKERL
ncbi:hypothetical protein V3I05_05460 [Helicobacter mastomyrinus]|uniref:Uncharacterized protein n=1 Tax=Helicobacter mastomyrinus TaxID=287948 RepID=A0ABZ3F1X7_9HELI|nr:hypothetical protein [uncultured Helicobacter sp.]